MASSSAPSFGAVFQLIPGVQSYDWGIKGPKCRVAQFASSTKQLNFQAQQEKPYAELWMGTHPSMPSSIVPRTSGSSSQTSQDFPTLSSYLEQNPDLIGKSVSTRFSDENPGCLPFLFKVLSVGKALSIQAHPDKELGKTLHKERPEVYKDPNHKPEMAIALTPFSGFCGFRPLAEIVDFLQNVPEFAALVNLSHEQLSKAKSLSSSEAEDKEVKAILKTIFGNLMRSSKDKYEKLAHDITQRFQSASSASDLHVPEKEVKLLLKLSEEFPGDIGIFCTFLLNISSLQPGEALFLQANEPHAYLEGEILECMASSDNVVRAGLTPKLRDVDTLISMCTYQSGKGRGQMDPQSWKNQSGSGKALLYDPPIAEFSVVICEIEQADEEQKHSAVQGPSILLVMEGDAKLTFQQNDLKLTKGQVAFVGANTPISIQAQQAPLRLARAFVEA